MREHIGPELASLCERIDQTYRAGNVAHCKRLIERLYASFDAESAELNGNERQPDAGQDE